MATYTSNYGLHQWAPEDNFLRTDFNQDLQKIDTALGQKAEQSALSALEQAVGNKGEFVRGEYTGTGTGTISIDLGFRPSVVWVATLGYCGMADWSYGEDSLLQVTYSGFDSNASTIHKYNPNMEHKVYCYLAMR